MSPTNRLSTEFKGEAFNWAKGCNFNLNMLIVLNSDGDVIQSIMRESSKTNDHFLKLLNKEYRSNESVDVVNKFDFLLVNASKIGVSSCDKLIAELDKENYGSIKALKSETEKMKQYYEIIINHYNDSVSDKSISNEQMQIIMDEINEVENDHIGRLDISCIQCSENINMVKAINLVKFFKEHGEEMCEDFQTHIGVNEDYMSINFSVNGSWFNIGQYNDDGFSRTIVQKIEGPDVELSEPKELMIHGEVITINNQIRRNINKKVSLMMK